MAKTKAFVMDDGEVLSQKYMDQYATKTKESQQIPEDRFHNSYDANHLVEPHYTLEALAELPEINTAHYRASRAKATDTVGHGYYLEPAEGVDNPDEKQKEIIKDFMKRPNDEDSFIELYERFMTDFNTVGAGMFEVVRDPSTGLISHLLHIPTHTIRKHSDEKRYVQKRGAATAWFKRFGMKEDVHVRTGGISNPNSIEKDEYRANEIIEMKNYTSRSDYYGVPDVISALGAILGDRERQEYNISFFDNHAIPAYAVTVSGAELDEDTERQIQDFFQKKVKQQNHSTLVLTAKKDEDDPSEAPVEFKFQALSTDTKEASFRMFRQDNRDEVLSAHGVPPYRAGVVVEGQMGGSNASETTEIYKQSIIGPLQERVEELINRKIIQDGLQCTDWVLRLKSIDNKDVKQETETLGLLFDRGAYSPNDLREWNGDERVDDPAMDKHYINGMAIEDGGQPSGEPAGGQASTSAKHMHDDIKELHERLVKAATKGGG